MKNKTAVDWLFNRLQSEPFLTGEDFNQANELFRNQIIDAHVHGTCEGIDIGCEPVKEDISKRHEQYYNDTYGDA